MKETRVPPMFIAALFIKARTWKQPRCPAAEKWIRKLWYIYTMEYYLVIKKNTFESVLMKWMKLEPIIQSVIFRIKCVYKSNERVCKTVQDKTIYSTHVLYL